MSSYYCKLLGEKIPYGRCIDINYELEGYKKEDEIKNIKRLCNLANQKIKETCKSCKHYPV